MNESGSDGREVLREKEERGGSVSERSILRRAEVFDQTDSVICFFFLYVINSHLCVVLLLFYFIFFSLTHSRAGLNLLEEKARKKINHGYGSLSATQVGSTALGPDSSARADNYFLLLYVLFFLPGRSN